MSRINVAYSTFTATALIKSDQDTNASLLFVPMIYPPLSTCLVGIYITVNGVDSNIDYAQINSIDGNLM